jgi:hypothetical protein
MARNFRCTLLALGIASLLVGCAPPTPVDNNSKEVSFRWQQGESSPGAANRVAKDHCQSWGKEAVPTERKQEGGAEFQRFDCR